MPTREAAIASLARLQKDNKEITQQVASYLSEPHFPVRMAALFALGNRGDSSAIPALEEMLKSNDLSIEMVPLIKGQIAKLKRPPAAKPDAHAQGGEDDDDDESAESGPAGGEKRGSAVAERLDKVERLLQEMNERLKAMETRLPAKP
jgi:HEAT repeat protein